MFRFFKKKAGLSEEQKRMNLLWENYASGELEEEDYAIFVLCDYEGGVNGEGHSGFFFNHEENLRKYDGALKSILPDELYANFLRACQSYGTEHEDEVCECADDFFYENEQEIIDILQNYANGMN